MSTTSKESEAPSLQSLMESINALVRNAGQFSDDELETLYEVHEILRKSIKAEVVKRGLDLPQFGGSGPSAHTRK